MIVSKKLHNPIGKELKVNPFLVLKNVYTSLLIYLMYENPEGLFTKFWMVRWAANVIWTLFLPLLIPLIVLKLIKRMISDEDAEESTKSAQEQLAIYGELSFYEWRSPKDVFLRVMTKHSSVKKVYEKENVVVASGEIDVSIGGVLIVLINGKNHFCEMRQETKEEYVKRCLADKFGPEPFNRKRQISHAIRKQRITPIFEEQFSVIEKVAGSDVFKSFWLGRQLVFKKKAAGNNKRNPPRESLLPNAV